MILSLKRSFANQGATPKVLEQVVTLAVELAREGREGKKVGTIFTVFNADKVMSRSRCMILDPLVHHNAAQKKINDVNLRETIKKLSQLDGAFVVDDDGVVLSACRYLDVSVEEVVLPLGLGVSMSKQRGCVSVAVSESSVVRIFLDGEIVSEIIPEIWLLKRHGILLEGTYKKRNIDDKKR